MTEPVQQQLPVAAQIVVMPNGSLGIGVNPGIGDQVSFLASIIALCAEAIQRARAEEKQPHKPKILIPQGMVLHQ